MSMNPNWAEGYYRVGRALFAAEDYARAEEAYQEGLKINPTDPNLVQGAEHIRRNFTKSQVPQACITPSRPLTKEGR
jgi:tetratricopeptide (TPR) repeat protein